MRGVRAFLSILQGRAIVLVKRDEHKADVIVGREIDKQFAINSMAGAVKTLML